MDVVVRAVRDVEELLDLAREADGEGHTFVSRLIEDHRTGANRFDRRGERLYVATDGDSIVGVCGLNRDPYIDDPRVGRVRHLYVSTARRREGVGSALLDQIVDDACGAFERLRLRTLNADAARFYLAKGFVAVAGDETCTHQRALGADGTPRAGG